MTKHKNSKITFLKKAIIAAIVTIFLAACGGDSNTTSAGPAKQSNADMEVDSYSQLPSCADKREGKTAYVVNQDQGYICQSGEWVEDDAVDVYSSSSAISSSSEKKSDKNSEPIKIVAPGDVIEGTMTDSRDGKIYKTVTIGSQTWMAENLAFDYKVDGVSYGTYANPDCDKCGLYYTWAAAMDSAAVFSTNAFGCGSSKTCSVKIPARSICLEGWHLPDSTEWEKLYSTMGKIAYAMQAKGFDELPDATDSYGFSVLPAGGFNNGRFLFVGSVAYFWSATEYFSDGAYVWFLDASDAKLSNGGYKGSGFSVRCLQDSL